MALIWGSSFILIKRGLLVFSPGELGALRITMAFLSLMPVALKHLRTIDRSKLPVLFVLGFAGSLLPSFLFAIAETQLDSSLTGVLNALTPIFVILISLIFFHQKIKFLNALGILVGFSGTIFMLLGGSGFDLSNFNYYAFYVVAATVFYGINVNLIKEYLPDLKALQITAVSLFLTSPFCVGYLFFFTDFIDKIGVADGFWLAFFYVSLLGVFGTAIALVLFNKLIQISTMIFASSVTYLIPIVAIGWGLVDNEVLNVYQYIGISIVLGGVYLANKKN
jgi:drug/metabolite transporter (DMT)-like permease